ncbi:hypothetical protein GQ53DRAFT_720430 [Thozetella sp. PMI_491]|nr:hypothetical protein GQ53DRAFT_720430 [Thozetella sp. PMI_491]
MALLQWALPQLQLLLQLEDDELCQVLEYSNSLDDPEAVKHLENLLGDSPQAAAFIASFIERRATAGPSSGSKPSQPSTSLAQLGVGPSDGSDKPIPHARSFPPPPYANSDTGPYARHMHSNQVIQASEVRARDEQEMVQMLQNLQFQCRIYNSEVEPEHESDFPCGCRIHQYKQRKWNRVGVQEMWCKAVMYPGEKFYTDAPNAAFFTINPYTYHCGSPYGYGRGGLGGTWGPAWGMARPVPACHAAWIRSTIDLHNRLNYEAQRKVDAQEPRENIWEGTELVEFMSKTMHGDTTHLGRSKSAGASGSSSQLVPVKEESGSRFSRFRKAIGVKTLEEKSAIVAKTLREAILAEEQGRWPDPQWRDLVASYQEKVGMTNKISELRAHSPYQYLHLLRAGYFEPIPVAWATRASNPLKFVVEAAAGWRGITPSWRGYEDLAEERLYWVLNHREGSIGMRMKPDFISEMNMARARMATAVEPPPLYFSPDDQCHLQHTSSGYSKQVMPPPFRSFDRPEVATDDTMILLDVSGSMDFDPVRPVYDQYLITRYTESTQPKNKDVARAVLRRFTDALAHHDRRSSGYDLITFANKGKYIGTIRHDNFDETWRNISFGGGTRVMTGWQMVKELHFRKHSASATHHPVYGWQAGPETPILRLLLLLDGEANDMDEFELDLLGLSWAHVTIFLIGVDGCPHHHRHANELQRISDVNRHISFVDAQGNCPERFVTHELLKRHLGYDVSMREFEEMEQLPAYEEVERAAS